MHGVSAIPVKIKIHSTWKQLAIRFKIRSRVLSSESTKEWSDGRWKVGGKSNSKRTVVRENILTLVLGASKPDFQNMEYTNH